MNNNFQKELSRLRREEGSKSLFMFAKLYMKDHLQFDPSPAHMETYHLLDTATIERGKKIAIAAPRDFGKSTLITHIHIIDCICYLKEKFIVIISNTSSQARQILDNIRKELTENELLKIDFPEIFEFRFGHKHLRWREEDIITRNNVRIMTVSSYQQIRGRRHGIDRPTLVIADDLEDSENTFSLETLDKRRDWYEKSVLKVGSKNSNYIFIGNLYHPHSLLSEYVSPDKNPTWIKKVYPAIVTWPKNMEMWDKWNNIYSHREQFEGLDGSSAAEKFYEQNKALMDEGAAILWDARYKLYDLMTMWAENEMSFMSEMQNMPRNPANCVFDIDKIVYWDNDGRSVDDQLRCLGDGFETFMACDPSLGLSGVKGDPSAIVVLAKDKKTGTLYILEADIKIRPIEDIVGDILAYYVRYKPSKIGIESNQFQRVLIDMVKKAGEKPGLFPNIVPMNNKDDKIARIQTLRPRIMSGNLQFSRKHRQLLEEARYFPKGRHDDGLDALEMAVRLSNDNGFMCWVGGSTRDIDPWTGKPMSDNPETMRADGLGVYGYMHGRRG
jgi:predicted phage terminase large subunit-like protein